MITSPLAVHCSHNTETAQRTRGTTADVLNKWVGVRNLPRIMAMRYNVKHSYKAWDYGLGAPKQTCPLLQVQNFKSMSVYKINCKSCSFLQAKMMVLRGESSRLVTGQGKRQLDIVGNEFHC